VDLFNVETSLQALGIVYQVLGVIDKILADDPIFASYPV
jgi:hypothetical protein